MNTTALQAIKERGVARPKKELWKPPTMLDFRKGKVLAFDQSLAACGLVVLESSSEGLTVHTATMFKTASEGRNGHEGDLDRAVRLAQDIKNWLITHHCYSPRDWIIAHEGVPEGGGSLRHPESSLLSAHGIRMVAADLGYEVFVPSTPPRTHKKFLCGNANAEKNEHHNAMEKLVDKLPIHNYHQITNEAKRDALSVGMYYLSKKAN